MSNLKQELITLVNTSDRFSIRRPCSTADELRDYLTLSLKKSAANGDNFTVIDKFDCNVEGWIKVIRNFCNEHNILFSPISANDDSNDVSYVLLHWIAARADFS